MSMKKILIDGDVIAYRCLAAATTTEYHIINGDNELLDIIPAGRDEDGKTGASRAKDIADGDPQGLTTVVREVIEPPINHVRHLINQMLEGIDIQYPDCKKEMYISFQGETWRYLIYPEYKAKRPPRPRMIDEVIQLLINEFGATYEDGLEADDTICMAAHAYTQQGIPWVIASVDKDFYQIPGLHYNFTSREETEITPQEAELNLWIQVIAGDSIDNIKGIPGVGVKGATNWLLDRDPDEDIYWTVWSLYDSHDMKPEDMLLTYKLVKLLENEHEKDSVPDWYGELNALGT